MNFGYYFSILVSLIIPLTLFIYVLFKAKDFRKAFIWGILSFSISQLFIRIPILQYVLADQAWYILFTMKYQLTAVFFLSVTAALFEETGRYLIFKKFLPNLNSKQILFFGLGHGGIETFVLVGLAYLSLSPNMASSLQFFYGGMERVSAVILHVSLSFFVYKSISKENKYGLFIAMTIHTLFNYCTLFLILNGVSTLLVECILFVSAIVVVYLSTRKKIAYEKMDI